MANVPPPPAGLHVEAWPAGQQPGTLQDWRAAGREGQGVIWVDVEMGADVHAIAAAVEEMGLAQWDQGFLAHVLSGFGPDDPGARSFEYYSETTAEGLREGRPVRFLAPTAFSPEVAPGPYEPPWVLRSQVAVLASPRWVMTRRRPAIAAAASGEIRQGPPHPLERLSRFARGRWGTHHRNGEDLALLILREILDTHPPALTSLVRRLSDLQLGYVRGVLPGEGRDLSSEQYRAALLEVHWVIQTLAGELFMLVRPGVPPEHAWFPVGPDSKDVATEIEQLLARTERSVDALRGQLSDSFALASSTEASQQLVLSAQAEAVAERAERRGKQIDNVVTAIATVLLGPGLVVAVYGAVPAIFDDHENLRWISMTAFSVLAGLLIYVGLRLMRWWGDKRSDEGPS